MRYKCIEYIHYTIMTCIRHVRSDWRSRLSAAALKSEGPGFKSRRRRWDSSVGQTANGPCLSRLSCINEYKVFLQCLPVYGGTTSATIRWCNEASPEVLSKKHLFPKGLLKKSYIMTMRRAGSSTFTVETSRA